MILKLFLFALIFDLSFESKIFNPATNYTFDIYTPRFRYGTLKKWDPFTTIIVPAGSTQEQLQSCKSLDPGKKNNRFIKR